MLFATVGLAYREAACAPHIWLGPIANFFALDLNPVRVITKVCAFPQVTIKHILRIARVPISLGVLIAPFRVQYFQDPFVLGEDFVITMELASVTWDSGDRTVP